MVDHPGHWHRCVLAGYMHGSRSRNRCPFWVLHLDGLDCVLLRCGGQREMIGHGMKRGRASSLRSPDSGRSVKFATTRKTPLGVWPLLTQCGYLLPNLSLSRVILAYILTELT